MKTLKELCKEDLQRVEDEFIRLRPGTLGQKYLFDKVISQAMAYGIALGVEIGKELNQQPICFPS